jgi:hypothetical protein
MNRHLKNIVAPQVIVLAAGVENGDAVVHALVRHWEPETLETDDVTLRVMPCNEANAVPADASGVVLSTHRFATGETKLDVRVPAATLADGCVVQLDLNGQTSGGLPVALTMGAEVRRRPALSPLTHQLTDDVAGHDIIARRLELAAKALGRDLKVPGTTITDDELRRLEAEGKIPPMPPPPPPPEP